MRASRSRSMPALCQPLQASAILALDLREGPAHDLTLRHEHEIEPANDLDLVPPEAFSEEPLRFVSFHGTADAPAHRKSKSPGVAAVLRRQHQKQRAIEPQALAEDPAKLRGTVHALFR